MFALITCAGFFLSLFFLVVLIVKAIRKKPLKPTLRKLLIAIIVCIAGFILFAITSCDHEYEETGREEPTCTEEGVIEYKCAKCGQTKTEEIEATGHKMQETQRIEPTETEDGKIVEICAVCGYEHITVLPKTSSTSSSQSKEDEAASPAESEQSDADKSKNKATTARTSDGTPLFIYPIDGPSNNIIFSNEDFDVNDLTLERTEDIGDSSKVFHFKGKVKNHSGRDYEAISIAFCLLDKDNNMLTDGNSGGYVVIGDSTNYIKDGEEYEFAVVIGASKYVCDHAENVAMYYLATAG